jgi:transglutaminase/protease-like cytokinesis protein 3
MGSARIDITDYPVQHDDDELNARIEEALQNMKEGSDRFILWQISNYLAERIEYDADQESPLDGLRIGRGECEVYSKLFYLMASRLGIETYICVGPVTGGYHAWNMVVLDGQPYFYDVCWFDGGNYKWLHSPNSWGREYSIHK